MTAVPNDALATTLPSAALFLRRAGDSGTFSAPRRLDPRARSYVVPWAPFGGGSGKTPILLRDKAGFAHKCKSNCVNAETRAGNCRAHREPLGWGPQVAVLRYPARQADRRYNQPVLHELSSRG